MGETNVVKRTWWSELQSPVIASAAVTPMPFAVLGVVALTTTDFSRGAANVGVGLSQYEELWFGAAFLGVAATWFAVPFASALASLMWTRAVRVAPWWLSTAAATAWAGLLAWAAISVWSVWTPSPSGVGPEAPWFVVAALVMGAIAPLAAKAFDNGELGERLAYFAVWWSVLAPILNLLLFVYWPDLTGTG